MAQVEESPYTFARFRVEFANRRQFVNLTVLGADSAGTHFYYEDERGDRRFGVITDLIGFPIVRAGVEPLTIAADNAEANVVISLSPALPGAITDYLVFAGVEAGELIATIDKPWAHGLLVSLSLLQVFATRPASTILASSQVTLSQTHTHAAHTPTTHSSVDINVTNPHTHDAHVLTHAGGGHTHLWPAIDVPANYLGLLEASVRVFWMIIRA